MAIESTVGKKQNLAKKAGDHCAAIVDAINGLNGLKEEFGYSGGWQDSDFSGNGDLQHMDSGMITACFGTMLTNLNVAYQDDAHGNQIKQILNQMRGPNS